LAKAPLQLSIPTETIAEKELTAGEVKIAVELVFMGHYGEPTVTLDYVLSPLTASSSQMWALAFDPAASTWIVTPV
jgi:hypothetical protein